MKTTIEIPDLLLRQAKTHAAKRGTTLKDLVIEALREKLVPLSSPSAMKIPTLPRRPNLPAVTRELIEELDVEDYG